MITMTVRGTARRIASSLSAPLMHRWFWSGDVRLRDKLALVADINSMALTLGLSRPRDIRRVARRWLWLRRTNQRWVAENLFGGELPRHVPHIRFSEISLLENALAAGRGAVLATFHFFHHFALLYALQTKCRELHTIVADRPVAEELATAVYNTRVTLHHRSEPRLFWRLRDVLRRNDVVVLYQDVAPFDEHHIEVPFRNGFHVRIARNVTCALAYASKCPIIPAVNIATSMGERNELRFFPPIRPENGESADAFTTRATGEMFALLAALVARHPWLWEQWRLLSHHGKVLGSGDAPSPLYFLRDAERGEILACRVNPLRIRRCALPSRRLGRLRILLEAAWNS